MAPMYAVVASLTVASAMTLKAAVTPVEKVIDLLGRLQTQVTEEGAKEAAEYDKFACFCKEQVDQKTYAIERSEEKVQKLSAKIDKLGAEITELDADVVELGTRIGVLEEDIAAEGKSRKAGHEEYLVADKDVSEAIRAVDAAIETLRASKSQLGFNQVGSVIRAQLARISGKARSVYASRALSLLAAVQSPRQPAAYKYQSNDIIAILQDLRKSFVGNKQAADEAEFQARASSEKKVLGLANERKFKEQSRAQKQQLSAEKSEEKEGLEKDRSEETTAKEADEAFRADLTAQCKSRAEEWDARSKSRAAELTAIAEAMEVLKRGVAPNYSANKKLVGLTALGKRTAKASLLQVEKDLTPVHRALAVLSASAGRLSSTELAGLVTRADLAEDHFVKVRSLISDLIAKLEAQAESEASQKQFCDENMPKAAKHRDEQQSAIESAAAKLSSETAKKAQLVEEIAQLHLEVAELSKALQEATQLRREEKASNEKTIADAEAGKVAVENAIGVLKEYYGSALLQQPGADREGKTVSDRAPELSYSGEYRGKQGASQGVIGLLEVISSDFERTATTVKAEEEEAQGKFDSFKKQSEASISGKEAEISSKEAAVKTAEAEIIGAKDSVMVGKRLHASALEELEKLHAMCVAGEESYAERRKKREQEIQALREALNILEDWKA
mmetsp:Transcript_52791/g.152216  ORF Transcript_52791/g.152216 Transcript_52791/m.152216 type:complete len:676 (-) Transcript_52791:126-2153(-)